MNTTTNLYLQLQHHSYSSAFISPCINLQGTLISISSFSVLVQLIACAHLLLLRPLTLCLMQPTSNNKRNAASRKRVHTKSLVQSTSILAQLADATPTSSPPPPEPPFQTLPEMPPDVIPEPAQELMTDLFFHEYSPHAAEPTPDVPLIHTESSPPKVPAPQKPPPPLGSSSMNDDPRASVHPPVDPGHVRSPVLTR